MLNCWDIFLCIFTVNRFRQHVKAFGIVLIATGGVLFEHYSNTIWGCFDVSMYYLLCSKKESMGGYVGQLCLP